MEALFSSFLSFDRSVFEWVEENLWHALGGFLDTLMVFITRLGDGGVLWIVLGIVLLIFRKTRTAGVAVLASLAVSGILNNLVLKEIFDRPRPFNLEAWQDWFVYPDFVAKPESSSFPSGHTSTSLASAVGVFCCKKKSIYIPATVIALLIGFSRIYIYVHYPTDVIAGVIVGIIYGLIGIAVASLVNKYVLSKINNKQGETKNA